MMSNRPGGSRKVHLHWVRETLPRVLELPVSVTLATRKGLPRPIADAIGQAGPGTVELHLPIFLQDGRTLNEWAEALTYRQDTSGRLIAEHPEESDAVTAFALHQATVLAWRAIGGDQTKLTLAAEPTGTPVLPPPQPAFRVCEPEGGLAAAPGERTANFARTYRKLALEFQKIIREWVPAQHLRSAADLADRPTAFALLAWSAAEPVVGPAVGDLGVDVLNEVSLRKACFSMRRNMAERLRQAGAALPALNLDHLSAAYSHKNANRILDDLDRGGNRHVRQLFHSEFRLIAAFVQFCCKIDLWRRDYEQDPVRAARGLHRQVRESLKECFTVANQFYQKRQQRSLVSRLLVETVRTLEISEEQLFRIPRAC